MIARVIPTLEVVEGLGGVDLLCCPVRRSACIPIELLEGVT